MIEQKISQMERKRMRGKLSVTHYHYQRSLTKTEKDVELSSDQLHSSSVLKLSEGTKHRMSTFQIRKDIM